MLAGALTLPRPLLTWRRGRLPRRGWVRAGAGPLRALRRLHDDHVPAFRRATGRGGEQEAETDERRQLALLGGADRVAAERTHPRGEQEDTAEDQEEPTTIHARELNRGGGRPAAPNRYFQVPVTVRVQPDPVLRVRLSPDSQVIVEPSFFTYLYSTVVLAGRLTVPFQTG